MSSGGFCPSELWSQFRFNPCWTDFIVSLILLTVGVAVTGYFVLWERKQHTEEQEPFLPVFKFDLEYFGSGS